MTIGCMPLLLALTFRPFFFFGNIGMLSNGVQKGFYPIHVKVLGAASPTPTPTTQRLYRPRALIILSTAWP